MNNRCTDTAKDLGLCPDLQIHKFVSSWRCARCGTLNSGPCVWIPPGVEVRSEPLVALEYGTFENNRGWCVKCAKVLSDGRPLWKFWK